MSRKILCVVVFALSSCASVDMYTSGSSVLLAENTIYEPTTQVDLLSEMPDRKYLEIAIVEARGSAGAGLPDLLERLRIEAGKVGANAVVPQQSGTQETPQSLIYNPLLGGYQTLGGQQTAILRGTAVRYDD